MTQADLKELIDFAKESRLEKESLQEVLYQKDFADQCWPYSSRQQTQLVLLKFI